MKEKVLIFYNYNRREYWFKYISSYLREKQISAKIFSSKKEILINNNIFYFVTSENLKDFIRGRRYIKIYCNMDYHLEKDFNKTLKEILSDGKSRN